jgi:hypothetical protein
MLGSDLMRPNIKDLEEWEGLCIWLNGVRKKATHWASGKIPYQHLLSQDPLMPEMRKWLKENSFELVFYSTGWGWRLRKDWKEKIEKLYELIQTEE